MWLDAPRRGQPAPAHVARGHQPRWHDPRGRPVQRSSGPTTPSGPRATMPATASVEFAAVTASDMVELVAAGVKGDERADPVDLRFLGAGE